MRNLVILRVFWRPFRPRCARATWCNGKAPILEMKNAKMEKIFSREFISRHFLKKLFSGISWNLFLKIFTETMKSPGARNVVNSNQNSMIFSWKSRNSWFLAFLHESWISKRIPRKRVKTGNFSEFHLNSCKSVWKACQNGLDLQGLLNRADSGDFRARKSAFLLN